MHAGMADRVLCYPLDIIDALCRDTCARQIPCSDSADDSASQRPAKVVHREDIFEKLRILEVANAAGLA